MWTGLLWIRTGAGKQAGSCEHNTEPSSSTWLSEWRLPSQVAYAPHNELVSWLHYNYLDTLKSSQSLCTNCYELFTPWSAELLWLCGPVDGNCFRTCYLQHQAEPVFRLWHHVVSQVSSISENIVPPSVKHRYTPSRLLQCHNPGDHNINYHAPFFPDKW
jgi:hypothetical protein